MSSTEDKPVNKNCYICNKQVIVNGMIPHSTDGEMVWSCQWEGRTLCWECWNTECQKIEILKRQHWPCYNEKKEARD